MFMFTPFWTDHKWLTDCSKNFTLYERNVRMDMVYYLIKGPAHNSKYKESYEKNRQKVGIFKHRTSTFKHPFRFLTAILFGDTWLARCTFTKQSDWDRSCQVNRMGSLSNRSISIYTKNWTDHNSRTTNRRWRDLVPGDRPHPYTTFIHTSYSENSHAQGARPRAVVAPYITLNTMVTKVGEVCPPTFGIGCCIHCSSELCQKQVVIRQKTTLFCYTA